MRKLLALVFSVALLAISIVALLSVTRFTTTPANAAPNPIEIISISELSSTSVEILFSSSVPKKSLSYFVINAVIDPSVGIPKNIKKTIKTKATGLITTEIKNLNPKASYKFTVSAKTNKAKMINSAAVKYSSLSILMDALSNLPAGWGNPKPIQIPAAAPTAAPVVLPAFTLTSSTETRTVNTAATGFTTNSTGSVITSFAINATPSNMSFNTTTGALTGTPNIIASATTYTITATNSSGSATQTFTLTVNAKATPTLSIFTSVSKASGAPAFTLTAPTVAGSLSGAFTYTSATTATATIAGATVTVVSGGTTLITATFTPTDTTEYNNATITMTLTVAYAVGNRGPGGGIVFYISTGAFTQTGATDGMCTIDCKYLEVAPATWQGPGVSITSDDAYQWSNNISTVTGQNLTTASTQGLTAQRAVEKLNWQIGQGFNNTSVMRVDGATSEAQAKVLAYAGSSTAGQWFIPSMNELNELCKYSRGQGTGDLTLRCSGAATIKSGTANDLGGFRGELYQSSSERDATTYWAHHFYSATNITENGRQEVSGKTNKYYLRPIRAFGP